MGLAETMEDEKWSGKRWEKGTPLCMTSRPRLEITRTQGQRLIATHYSGQLLPAENLFPVFLFSRGRGLTP